MADRRKSAGDRVPSIEFGPTHRTRRAPGAACVPAGACTPTERARLTGGGHAERRALPIGGRPTSESARRAVAVALVHERLLGRDPPCPRLLAAAIPSWCVCSTPSGGRRTRDRGAAGHRGPSGAAQVIYAMLILAARRLAQRRAGASCPSRRRKRRFHVLAAAESLAGLAGPLQHGAAVSPSWCAPWTTPRCRSHPPCGHRRCVGPAEVIAEPRSSVLEWINPASNSCWVIDVASARGHRGACGPIPDDAPRIDQVLQAARLDSATGRSRPVWGGGTARLPGC